MGLIPVSSIAGFETDRDGVRLCSTAGARGLANPQTEVTLLFGFFGERVDRFNREDPKIFLGAGSISDAPTLAFT